MYRRRVGAWILLVIMLIWSILPLYWFGKFAFMNNQQISAFPPNLYPPKLLLSGFFNVLGSSYTDPSTGIVYPPSGQSQQIVNGLKNSAIVAVIVTIITMIVVVPLGYAFGRLEFRMKTGLLMAILLSVLLPPVSVIIPFFIIYNRLGLSGTLLGLIIVTLTTTIPFVTWMMLGYFRNLPKIEALARIDGYSRVGTFVRIVIPLAKTGIVVGALISFLFAWNEYTFAQVLVTGTPAATIPPAISGFFFQVPHPQHLAAALIYSVLVSFIAIYFLQRHITKLNIVEVLGG